MSVTFFPPLYVDHFKYFYIMCSLIPGRLASQLSFVCSVFNAVFLITTYQKCLVGTYMYWYSMKEIQRIVSCC